MKWFILKWSHDNHLLTFTISLVLTNQSSFQIHNNKALANSNKIAGIEISTPSNGIPFNFDSLMEGGTGLTPVHPHPLHPHLCAQQQRAAPDAASDAPGSLVSLWAATPPEPTLKPPTFTAPRARPSVKDAVMNDFVTLYKWKKPVLNNCVWKGWRVPFTVWREYCWCFHVTAFLARARPRAGRAWVSSSEVSGAIRARGGSVTSVLEYRFYIVSCALNGRRHTSPVANKVRVFSSFV